MTIHEILIELTENNSSNYKLEVLQKYKDNELLQRVLKMTYDNVAFTYGISLQNTLKFTPSYEDDITLQSALDILEHEINSKNITGNAALQTAANMMFSLSDTDSEVFKRIINRDIKCDVGVTQINKVWSNLITKQIYMRCGTYNDKTKKKIQFPAYIQLKADGTYREFTVNSGNVQAKSRSGESYDYPIHFKEMETFPDGVYTGELTVRASTDTIQVIRDNLEIALIKGTDTELLHEIIQMYEEKCSDNEEYILPRAIGNGLLNSLNPPHNDIVYDVWDYITLNDYKFAGDLKNVKFKCSESIKDIKRAFDNETISKDAFKQLTKLQKSENIQTVIDNTPKIKYCDRFEKLTEILQNSDNIRTIEHYCVNTLQEALEQTSKWMNQGFEGGVLKNCTAVFKDGTNEEQLKLKIKIDTEMRVNGFNPGTIGGKREGKVGSLIFCNDEGTIKGKCSGFSDKELDEMTTNPDKYLNKIITVQFNDLSKARGNNYHALSHPRFIEIRNDKTETDTLQTVFSLREMAICLTK